MYLDFDKQEKGYKKLAISKDIIKKNIGRKMCYVHSRLIDERGYYTVHYGVIHSVKYNQVYFDNKESQIHIKDIKEAGIEIDKCSICQNLKLVENGCSFNLVEPIAECTKLMKHIDYDAFEKEIECKSFKRNA